MAYAAAGEAGRAISLHEAVLQRLRAKLGEEHITTLVTMNNLARAYEAGLRYDESIALYEKTLPKLREAQRGPSYRADGHVRVGAGISLCRTALTGDRLVRRRSGKAPA